MEFEPEAEQMHEHEFTNLRVIDWLNDLPADPKKRMLKIQDIDQISIKYTSHDNIESNWIAPDGPSCVPESNLDLIDPKQSAGRRWIFLSGEWG